MFSKKFSIQNLFTFLYTLVVVVFVVFFILQGGKMQNKVLADTNNQQNISNNQSEVKKDVVYSYDILSKSPNPKLYIGDKVSIALKVRNTGNTTWESDSATPVFLGANRPIERIPVIYSKDNKGWFSANRIMMDKKIVKPGATVNFIFDVKAPDKSGIYREFFNIVVDNVKWMEDKNISWDIETRDPKKENEKLVVVLNGGSAKYIRVSLKEQKLYAYENGEAKYEFITSTGLAGMDTPTGKFEIRNKFSQQYSSPYQLYMDNWMAITQSGAYGIHSLPFWKTKNGGRIYEGEEHLGKKVSHGCIRLSLENSKILYDWAEVGTPVFIEN